MFKIVYDKYSRKQNDNFFTQKGYFWRKRSMLYSLRGSNKILVPHMSGKNPVPLKISAPQDIKSFAPLIFLEHNEISVYGFHLDFETIKNRIIHKMSRNILIVNEWLTHHARNSLFHGFPNVIRTLVQRITIHSLKHRIDYQNTQN